MFSAVVSPTKNKADVVKTSPIGLSPLVVSAAEASSITVLQRWPDEISGCEASPSRDWGLFSSRMAQAVSKAGSSILSRQVLAAVSEAAIALAGRKNAAEIAVATVSLER